MRWGDVVGHGWVVKILRRHIGAGEMRQAYLLVGPAEIGKRTVALAFSSAVLCPKRTQLGEACGECDACRTAADESHPDLHVIGVEEGASSISIDQIRRLQGQIALSPYQADRRIVLIEDTARLTTAASNALLKTLEEPPPNVILLLLAEDSEQVLPTIASRCTQIPFRLVSRRQIESALRREVGDEELVTRVAALSMGRPGTGFRLLRDEVALQERSDRVKELFDLVGADMPARFAYVDESLSAKSRRMNAQIAGRILEGWLSIWRDVLLNKSDASSSLANPDFVEGVRRLVAQTSQREILRVLKAIRTSLLALSRYGNPTLAMEIVLLDTPGLA